MKICGLITEYNPFHNGHLYHLNASKATTGCDYTVAVMSGHFLQRGEPALMDKWTRAEMAVKAGVDLVVELPVYYATASAEAFAEGAIRLLGLLGVTDVVFGSESGDLEAIEVVARLIESPTPAYQTKLKEGLDQGLSFPAARQVAIEEALGQGLAFKSNNILGIAYLRAMMRQGVSFKAHTIKRIQNDYHDTQVTSEICSATAIREQLKKRPIDWETLKSVMPKSSYEALLGYPKYTSLEDFHSLMNLVMIREGKAIKTYRGFSEGIENKFLSHMDKLGGVEHLVDQVKSKRYTRTRIQRMLIAMLMGFPEDYHHLNDDHLDYLRILAFNDKGAEIIRQVKKQGGAAIFTNLGRDLKKYRRKNPLIHWDIQASNLYALSNHAIGMQEDYMRQPKNFGVGQNV